jgi:hypothetical protein
MSQVRILPGSPNISNGYWLFLARLLPLKMRVEAQWKQNQLRFLSAASCRSISRLMSWSRVRRE